MFINHNCILCKKGNSNLGMQKMKKEQRLHMTYLHNHSFNKSEISQHWVQLWLQTLSKTNAKTAFMCKDNNLNNNENHKICFKIRGGWGRGIMSMVTMTYQQLASRSSACCCTCWWRRWGSKAGWVPGWLPPVPCSTSPQRLPGLSRTGDLCNHSNKWPLV